MTTIRERLSHLEKRWANEAQVDDTSKYRRTLNVLQQSLKDITTKTSICQDNLLQLSRLTKLHAENAESYLEFDKLVVILINSLDKAIRCVGSKYKLAVARECQEALVIKITEYATIAKEIDQACWHMLRQHSHDLPKYLIDSKTGIYNPEINCLRPTPRAINISGGHIGNQKIYLDGGTNTEQKEQTARVVDLCRQNVHMFDGIKHPETSLIVAYHEGRITLAMWLQDRLTQFYTRMIKLLIRKECIAVDDSLQVQQFIRELCELSAISNTTDKRFVQAIRDLHAFQLNCCHPGEDIALSLDESDIEMLRIPLKLMSEHHYNGLVLNNQAMLSKTSISLMELRGGSHENFDQIGAGNSRAALSWWR